MRNAIISCAMWATCLWLSACDEGTNSGNPVLPAGAELVKSDQPRDRHPQVSTSDALEFAQNSREFAFDLYGALAKDNTNLVFSPYSLWSATAMAYAGARTTTASEMQSALHFNLPQSTLHAAFNDVSLQLNERKNQLATDSDEEGEFTLQTLNQLWVQKGARILPGYLDVLSTNYDAGLLLVNFDQTETTRSRINDWAKQQTGGRVEDLLPSLPAMPKFALTTTIYLKASWLTKFDPKRTDDGTFDSNAGARKVQMMHMEEELQYAEGADYQAVELPLVSDEVRVLLILPADGRFDAVSQGCDAKFFDEVRNDLNSYWVTLSLPRWSTTWRGDLTAMLEKLGMRAAFDGQVADFSGVDAERDLWIAALAHGATIAVDEQGVEAAAASAELLPNSGVGDAVTITFDRPFLFAVYDASTGQVLFLGHLQDPG